MTDQVTRAALKLHVQNSGLHPRVERTMLDVVDTLELKSVGTANTANVLALGAALTTPAAAGITGGTGTVYQSSISKVGGIITTQILLDLTGLSSSTTDLDIIGQSTPAAHLGQITAADNGTILTGWITCLETPAGGVTDIDFYSATEATGAFDTGIGTLDETALHTNGGAWSAALATQTAFSAALPAADQYLYACGGAAGTAAAYTAGQFLLTFLGYDA